MNKCDIGTFDIWPNDILHCVIWPKDNFLNGIWTNSFFQVVKELFVATTCQPQKANWHRFYKAPVVVILNNNFKYSLL